ncbi:MAG: hypothetical protein K2K97_03960, partial [Muribaculaceae bacterium]|nr:hypothetical protein [Muribaculaceae bacterium]
MIANLFLHPYAFVYNGVDSREVVKDKFVALVQDMKEVVYNYSKENFFKLTSTFINTEIYDKESVIDFACSVLDSDDSGVFFTMIANTADGLDDISFEQLQDMCKYREQELEINSLVILNRHDIVPDDKDSNS